MLNKTVLKQASKYALIISVVSATMVAIAANDGLKVFTDSTAANSNSNIVHTGTGILQINAQDSGNIAMMTNNLTRMTIQSGGNIGIGTTNPQYVLDVNAPVRFGCPSGMVDSGAGFCIDSADTAETAYGSGIATCSSAGKTLCSFRQLCTAKYRGVGSLGTSYRISDMLYWTGGQRHYYGGSTASNMLNMPSACSSISAPGPQSGTRSFRCCRDKG